MGVQITQEMIDGAKQTQEKYGVPASITLGQIILESGGSYKGGLSGLAYRAKNLFGIKAGSSWDGETVSMATKEEGKNGTYSTTAKFRKYDSFIDSILDHGKLLAGDRYQKYVKGVTDYKEYAKGIAKAGYATDSNYANKLIKIIEDNDLAKYDTGATGTTTTADGDNGFFEGIAKNIMKACIVAVLAILCVLFIVNAFGVSVTEPVKKVVKKKGGES